MPDEDTKITLTFSLGRNVPQQDFIMAVLLACMENGVLQPGEGIMDPTDPEGEGVIMALPADMIALFMAVIGGGFRL